MGKSNNAPRPPDPQRTAQAQAAANKEAVRESAKVSQTGIESPWGRQYYSGPLGTVGPGGRRLIVELAPEQQRVLSAQNELAGLLSEYGAGTLGPNVLERLGTSPDVDPGAVEEAIYQRGLSRIEPQYNESEELLRSRLMSQGIPVGSRAYNQAMDQFGRQRADAMENLALSSTIAGAAEGRAQQAEQRAQRNQAINELSALLQGSPAAAVTPGPSAPYTPYQIAPPDIAGLTSQQYAGQLNAYNQRAQQLGGLYGLGGNLAAAGILAAGSDIRMKRDIVPLGVAGGFRWYSFRYFWNYVRHVGVMAQEVMKSRPDAVFEHDGWLYVDYGRLLRV